MTTRLFRGALAGCACLLPLLPAACSSASGTTPPTPDGGHDAGADAKGDAHAEGGGHDGGGKDASHDAGTDSGKPLTLLNDELSNGTRLKGKWLETTDGFSELEALHDTLVDIDCAWDTAEDGMLRCLPTNVAQRTYNNGLMYSDDTCTTPVYEVSSGACAPGAGAFYTEDVALCPSGTRVFQIGATVSAPATVYGKDTGVCTSFGAPPAGDTFYGLTTVAPTTFLGGTETVEKGSGHLAPAFVTGGDGSKSFRFLRDTTASNTPCDFTTAADGMLRCLPTTPLTVSGTDFVDVSCTMLAASGEATTCTTLPFATSTTTSGCPTTTTVYTTGAVASSVYTTQGGGCSAENVTGPSFFAAGAEAKASTFTLGASEAVPGSSRIQAEAVVAGTLAVAPSAANQLFLYDTMRKESCISVTASDMKLRCVPIDVGDPSSIALVFPGGFSDAACTKPLALGGVGCKLPPYAYTVMTCGGLTVGVYDVVKAVTTAYVMSGASCMGVSIPTGYLGYEVGAEVPASSFEPLEEKVH